MEVTGDIIIPEEELGWSFARSSGPGGQNVNKVASKAILRWNLSTTSSLPDDVLLRLQTAQHHRIAADGDLIIQGQRFRDQAKNIEDCREKLRQMILQALHVPKPRRPTRPSRASKQRRLAAKRQQAQRKASRKPPSVE
jgi:ribosome-associated protein